MSDCDESGEHSGYQKDGDNLNLALSPETVEELVAILSPTEGTYEFRSFPDLRIQVLKTFIKDQKAMSWKRSAESHKEISLPALQSLHKESFVAAGNVIVGVVTL